MKAGDCIHFNGVHHRVCSAGVVYKTLGRPLPCLLSVVPGHYTGVVCDSFHPMTKKEEKKETEELRAIVKRVSIALMFDTCHICGANAEPSKKIGRCIYNACGHRRGPS